MTKDVTTCAPEVYDLAELDEVTVEIEGRAPAPCNALNDGGFLSIANTGGTYHLRVSWHGGDAVREEPPDRDKPYSNLVFLPTAGHPTACGFGATGGCADTCPNDERTIAGCEHVGCLKCGCEITDGMMGLCRDAEYERCDDQNPCDVGDGPCEFLGRVGPGERSNKTCNQTICTENDPSQPPDPEDPDPYCPDIDDAAEDTNCCDQQFNNGAHCDDPLEVKCTNVESGYEFVVTEISDDGVNWVDLEKSGIVLPSPTTPRESKCCDFVCVDLTDPPANPPASTHCESCESDSDCTANETCISSCRGTCSTTGADCFSTSDCETESTPTAAETCDFHCS